MTHEVWCNNYSEIYHKLPAEFTSDRILKIGQYLVGTCKASRFDLNRTSRFDSKVTGRFKNFESPRLPRLPSYHKQH